MGRPPQWTLRSLIAVIVIVAVVISCLMLPGVQRARRAHNEIAAHGGVGALFRAEDDFRCNDRDQDGAQNYWVGDVYGLYGLCPLRDGVDPAHMLRLIEPSLAAADVTPCEEWPGCVPPAQTIQGWTPRSGYVFRAFAARLTPAGPQPYGEQGRVAGGGRCLNADHFAFCAAPLSRAQGHQMYITYIDFGVRRGDPGDAYGGVYECEGRRATFRWTGGSIGGTAFTPETPLSSAPGCDGWSTID